MTATFPCTRCGRDGLTIPRALCPSCRSVGPRIMHLDPDHDWREEAACIGIDSELFYQNGRETADERVERVTAAKAVCARCPVTAECLKWAADSGDRYAILAGLTPSERTTIRRAERRKDKPHKPINHGTTGGYQTHIHRGEDPCDACKAAKAEYRRAKRAEEAVA